MKTDKNQERKKIEKLEKEIKNKQRQGKEIAIK